MNNIHHILLISSLAILTACGTKVSQPTPTDDTTNNTTIPVETEAANTTYPPAFEGQTRIGGIQTKTPYQVEVLDKTLNKPWGIATLPDGRFLITEKKGTMRIASATGTVGEPITGIPEVNSGGQGGLLGLCIDPSFDQNRMVYWVFSEQLPEGNLTAVAKGRLAADEKTIENATVIVG